MATLAPISLPTLREWRAHFQSRGVRDEIVDEYITYIRPLVKRKVPVIFDGLHLAALLGRTPQFVTKAASASHCFYRHFQIKKRSGGFRDIHAPYPSLKECQRWIADNILRRLAVGSSATAYVPGRSILDHVNPHLGEDRGLLVVDLKDFFPSISKRRVIGFFRSLGYNNEVAVLLGSLCCLNGVLPQGSPASPYISNQIAAVLDRRLVAICKKFDLSYTRYADDICISGKEIPHVVLDLLISAVIKSGFLINSEKTRRYSARSTSKILTGLNIGSGVPRLLKSFRREIDHQMHFIREFGYLSHVQSQKIYDPSYLSRLRGWLEYWRFVEPENAKVLSYIEHLEGLRVMHQGGH